MRKILSLVLVELMVVSVLPMSVFAASFDTSASNDYYVVISEKEYALAPGATETELLLNNKTGDDRKVVHIFEVDTKNEQIQVLPGYYGIENLDPDNLALEGVEDKTKFWKSEQLTKTVAYYESLGYNVVGAMNTALAYDSEAPYGYMVYNGVVLGTPEVHKGAKTYLAIDGEGNCELRSMSTPLKGNEVTAVSANFDWLVKNGELVSKTVERTSSNASRSMIGIKADGTLVFCQVDGRNEPFSSGLSNYEMGEMMLALGCVNAVNCDGGGSSTFVSKREGETTNTMRSIPSDGSERATINSVIIVSKAVATGEFDHAILETEYDYYAPGTKAKFTVKGVDSAGSSAELPAEGITWQLSDDTMGTVADGVFTSNGKKGDVTIQMLYNGEVVGEYGIHVVDPDVFAFAIDETVLPYGKTMTLNFACTYGADDWDVCVDGAYKLTLSDSTAAVIDGNKFTATKDESSKGVNVTATYIPNPSVTDVLKVTYGKGSEILYNFEDGDVSDWVGFDEAKQYSIDNGINNTLVSSEPLAGQCSDETDGSTFLATRENGGQVKNGDYALAWRVDNTAAAFESWTYNVLFNIGGPTVLRDVANGKNATKLGMWLYIPEGAAGLAFQSQLYTKKADGSLTHVQAHFTFTTKNGTVKNLNSCTEADIPESRWVYASIALTSADFICMPDPADTTSERSPSVIRTYVKPKEPAVHTFYIDDITLDYSTAVDDRVLPTITDVCYTPADEAKVLNDGAAITENTMAFSATVADNAELDNSTGVVYIDGVAVASSKVAGKYLTTENVKLTNGTHTVAFEIKDTLGNLSRVTRTFTVGSDALVSIGGHNDSGELAETDSIYYIDINTSDVAAIDGVKTTINLQNANTWELDGLVVADGFKATATVNEITNNVTVEITRVAKTADTGALTLVSIPVRVWSWNAINHFTGAVITPDTQYATGNNPYVYVNCKVLEGTITFADKKYSDYFATFGGSYYTQTNIRDVIAPWHKHDSELTVLNKDTTCVADGYENRTYCESCASVIDWGTVNKATGHNYAIIDGKYTCTVCKDAPAVSGLTEVDGNNYYLVGGNATTGWQSIDDEWYYFDKNTFAGLNGEHEFAPVTYSFTNGKLDSGEWAKTLYGNKYYFGPDYYGDRGSFRVIDGKEYYFESGIALHGGWQLVMQNQINRVWYFFNDDGTVDKTKTLEDGFYTDRKGYAYCKDGMALTGDICIDGKYYHFDLLGYAVNNGVYAGRLYHNSYTAYTGFLEENGVRYYYKDGRKGPYGLVEVDGEYYFSDWGGVVRTSGTYYIDTTNCDLPAGEYTFDENGHLVSGILNVKGVDYLFANGKKAKEGLYKIDGAYYCADWNGAIKAGGRFYAGTSYCDLPVGNYTFGADGKMLNGPVEVNGTKYLYVNGTTATCGLYEIDGDYYYSWWGGVLKTDGRYYVDTTFCDLPKNNNYSFDKDGKMLNGVVNVDGVDYLYINGTTATCGLYEVDGDYYYSWWGGVLKKDGRFYVDTTFCDLPKNNNYTFGKDGKMLNGPVEIDGTKYLYLNGSTANCGLYNIDGDYYYSWWGGVLKTDGRFFVDKSYCDLSIGNYEFDADGKMLNGIVEKDGKMYYYVNGTTAVNGLTKIGDDYYFVNWGGEIMTSGKYYVDTTRCDLPVGHYIVGADGKLVDGFVTEVDGIHYYENGKPGKLGLNYVDGYYYFVKNGEGLLVTNQKYYVWETNGYCYENNYKFDALGRITGM